VKEKLATIAPSNAKRPACLSEVGPFLLLFVMCANLKRRRLGTVSFEAIGAAPRLRLRSAWRRIDL
jgi:hypothetical protein